MTGRCINPFAPPLQRLFKQHDGSLRTSTGVIATSSTVNMALKTKFKLEDNYLPSEYQLKVEFKQNTKKPNLQAMTRKRNWFKGYVLTKLMGMIHHIINGRYFLSENEHNEMVKALNIIRGIYKNHKKEHYILKKNIKNNYE